MTEHEEKVLKAIKEMGYDRTPYSRDEVGRVISMAIKALEQQPQDRPKGHWIWQTEDKYQCSCCGEVIRVKEVMNKPQYIACPLCDAKMGVE